MRGSSRQSKRPEANWRRTLVACALICPVWVGAAVLAVRVPEHAGPCALAAMAFSYGAVFLLAGWSGAEPRRTLGPASPVILGAAGIALLLLAAAMVLGENRAHTLSQRLAMPIVLASMPVGFTTGWLLRRLLRRGASDGP